MKKNNKNRRFRRSFSRVKHFNRPEAINKGSNTINSKETYSNWKSFNYSSMYSNLDIANWETPLTSFNKLDDMEIINVPQNFKLLSSVIVINEQIKLKWVKSFTNFLNKKAIHSGNVNIQEEINQMVSFVLHNKIHHILASLSQFHLCHFAKPMDVCTVTVDLMKRGEYILKAWCKYQNEFKLVKSNFVGTAVVDGLFKGHYSSEVFFENYTKANYVYYSDTEVVNGFYDPRMSKLAISKLYDLFSPYKVEFRSLAVAMALFLNVYYYKLFSENTIAYLWTK